MPLAFQSKSHGSVAFGFFHIETDMLLLDRCFFFCTDFCRVLSEMAASGDAATTGVACANTKRNFIGIELDQTYFNIAKDRILKAEESQ